MNFTDKNIVVNRLIDLSKKDFVLKFRSFFETKSDSIKSEIDSQLNYFYSRLPQLVDFLTYMIEKNNSRLLLNEFFNELKGNYDLINDKDYKYFSEQIDIWNYEIKLKTEEKIKLHEAIYQREQKRKNKTIIEYDSQNFQDLNYLRSVPGYGKFDFGKMKYIKTDLTEDFYKDIKPDTIPKDFLEDYLQLWNKCKSDFNAIVQLPLELFSKGQFQSLSYKINLEDIKEFKKFSDVKLEKTDEWTKYMQNVPEQIIKENFCKILVDIPKKDWAGELNDHFTSSLEHFNIKHEAVFLFKGPAGKNKFREMRMKDLGKNADQIVRLFKTNASLIILQHCHQIGEDVRDTMDAFAFKHEKKYCLIDGRDTYILFKAYNLT